MKKLVYVSGVFLFFAMWTLGAGLVAHYTFDNAGDLGNDSSTNGNFDLTVNSGFIAAEYTAAGKVAGAARFATNSSYITPTNIYSTPSFTFAAWVKADHTNVISIVAPTAGRGGFQAYASGGTWRGKINRQDAAYAYRIIGPVVADEWAHIALTFAKSSGPDANGNYTGAFKVYLNGAYVTGYNPTNYCPNTSYTMRMGAISTTGIFEGLMDEVRVYDDALTAGEIAALAAPPSRHVKLITITN